MVADVFVGLDQPAFKRVRDIARPESKKRHGEYLPRFSGRCCFEAVRQRTHAADLNRAPYSEQVRRCALTLGMLFASVVSAGCVEPPASGAISSAPAATAPGLTTSPASIPSAAATAGVPLAGASWTGIYYRLSDSATPMKMGGRLQIVAAEARFPGRVMHPDLTWWGANVPRWSPDGRRVLLRDRDNTVYIGTVGVGFQPLAVGRVSGWEWISPSEIATVHQRGGGGSPLENVFVRVDAQTGRVIHEQQVSLGVTMSGTFSPDGKWLVYAQPGPHRPMPTYSFEFATQRQVVLSDAAVPAGWVADGRAVLSRDDGTIELLAPDGQRREALFSGAATALAEPHTNVVVIVDREKRVWMAKSGTPAVRSPVVMPADGFRFHTLSADGEWASFTEPIPRPFPQIGSERAGVVHLPSGRIQYACERDCQWLAIR